MRRSRYIFFVFTAALLLFPLTLGAQTTKQIRSLQSQRRTIEKRISAGEGMKRSLGRNVKSQLSDLKLLNGQISNQKQYVDAISADVDHLTGRISKLNTQLDTLKAQLEIRKRRYRKAMLYLYRNRNTQSKLMFIFSAGDFSQMLRRIRYVREYARYQRVQGELVKRKQIQVDAKHAQVVRTRDAKNVLLSEGRTQQSKLEIQHAERTKIVNGLQKKLSQVNRSLNADKRKYNALNARIDALIQAQIAAENKRREAARRRAEAERKAREAAEQRRIAAQRAAEKAAREAQAEAERKAAASGKKTPAKVAAVTVPKVEESAPLSAPKMSKEDAAILREDEADRALSHDFAANQGRLPMPITGGYVITSHYGLHNVEGLRGVQVDNKGINITGRSGAQARAIFDGVVTAVFSMGGYSNVLVRHGSYISAYCNLSSVSVRRGEKVRTRQTLGSVARDASGNCTLQFQLRRETARLNPETWLAR